MLDSESQLRIHQKRKHLLKSTNEHDMQSDRVMRRKKAIITVELVDESVEESDKGIELELLEWFREDSFIPWVKDVKDVTVKDY
jgi:hypothetical protein